MRIVLFEDLLVPRLAPISWTRPAYAISCGGERLVDLVGEFQLPVHGLVRSHLCKAQSSAYAVQATVELPSSADTLWVNARLASSCLVRQTLRRMLDGARPCAVWSGGQLAAAWLPAGVAPSPEHASGDLVQALFTAAGLDRLPATSVPLPLLDYPHDVIRLHKQHLTDNLAQRLRSGAYSEIAPGVFAAERAVLGPYVATDTSAGPIVLAEGASVGAHSFVRGPVYLGREASLLEQACAKDAVALGEGAKIGGQVVASVVESFSSKQHHGYLGNSYVGSWVNLGAGTSNSDLKNTYGEIRMEYAGQTVPTGSQFMGCVIGDYVKSAVNTALFTGKTVGVCSMLYGFVTANVPSFVNFASSLGQVTELPPEVAISVQQRAFARRGAVHRPHDSQLLRDVYELTRCERQRASVPVESGRLNFQKAPGD